jgi:hypothetical protein
MANFTRSDLAGHCRFVINTGPLASDLEVRAYLPFANGEESPPIDLTRAEIVAATTGAERTATRSLLDKLRAAAVAKAGGA